MKNYSKSFKALWIGEIVSELGGAAGGIVNGLLLYELTGSKEWMGILWLIYFIPSLILQCISSPFLNYMVKERLLRNIQLIRSFAYLLPLLGFILVSENGAIIGLFILQCLLGLMQPIYASLSFSLLPELCEEKELVNANALLDGTLRLMSFLAPGAASLFLLFIPIHFIYVFSAIMFLISFLSLKRLPDNPKQAVSPWTKRFWWKEMKEGYKIFFQYPGLFRLTLLSSTVQFAVGVTMVLSVPFIRGSLDGEYWEYAIFSAAFPVGYVIGTWILTSLPKSPLFMYIGLMGGGLSFILLFFTHSIPYAWLCELSGGILFPLFNAQSAAMFQKGVAKERLAQLSSVRLFFLRLTMPLGILFASSPFWDLGVRPVFLIIGTIILVPGLFYFLITLKNARSTSFIQVK
ncbi:MFS transporter [Pradoshia sp. D12]|uniref:MFS transporter n=1 Tax=Bacillaceae TaxID=186817 RepID=UPI001127DD17|nr:MULTISPECIES: MFS transporter [Bacillaceae]QFK71450.1 MFS transporter [Pradoshia sp. D12]TPF73245.1 MFS transporter [Bacillus sp. D12]